MVPREIFQMAFLYIPTTSITRAAKSASTFFLYFCYIWRSECFAIFLSLIFTQWLIEQPIHNRPVFFLEELGHRALDSLTVFELGNKHREFPVSCIFLHVIVKDFFCVVSEAWQGVKEENFNSHHFNWFKEKNLAFWFKKKMFNLNILFDSRKWEAFFSATLHTFC